MPIGWQRGQALASLLFPECEIQVLRAGALETDIIKGPRNGDTVRGRISAFIDIARREKAAVMFVCDNEAQTETMIRLMRQAMPELRRTCPQAFSTAPEFGPGFCENLRRIAGRHATGFAAGHNRQWRAAAKRPNDDSREIAWKASE